MKELTEYTNPPQDASPENLKGICGHLIEGEATSDELNEEIEMASTLISDSLRYGVLLGFLEETDGTFSTTKRGTNWYYTNKGSPEAHSLFRDGMEDYKLFFELLNHIVDSEVDREESIIRQSYIIKILRTEFGFSLSENTLKNGANTFLETMAYAGYGEYIIGRGGKETRLEGNDSLIEASLEGEKEAEQDERTPPTKAEEQRDSQSKDRVPSTTDKDAALSSVDLGVNDSTGRMDINLELSGSEDPENIFNIIISIRKALEQPLGEITSGGEENTSDSESFETEDLTDFIDGESNDHNRD